MVVRGELRVGRSTTVRVNWFRPSAINHTHRASVVNHWVSSIDRERLASEEEEMRCGGLDGWKRAACEGFASIQSNRPTTSLADALAASLGGVDDHPAAFDRQKDAPRTRKNAFQCMRAPTTRRAVGEWGWLAKGLQDESFRPPPPKTAGVPRAIKKKTDERVARSEKVEIGTCCCCPRQPPWGSGLGMLEASATRASRGWDC